MVSFCGSPWQMVVLLDQPDSESKSSVGPPFWRDTFSWTPHLTWGLVPVPLATCAPAQGSAAAVLGKSGSSCSRVSVPDFRVRSERSSLLYLLILVCETAPRSQPFPRPAVWGSPGLGLQGTGRLVIGGLSTPADTMSLFLRGI